MNCLRETSTGLRCGRKTASGDCGVHDFVKKSAVERFREKYVIDATSGCWLWTGFLVQGYGRFWNDKAVLAHQFAYETRFGPVPDGLHLDHLCRVRNCVNPEHLEAVPPVENTRRIRGSQGAVCAHGHPWESNTRFYPGSGSRYCRSCHNERERRRQRNARPYQPRAA